MSPATRRDLYRAIYMFMNIAALPHERGGHVGVFLIGHLSRLSRSGPISQDRWREMIRVAARMVIMNQELSLVGPDKTPEPVLFMAVFLLQNRRAMGRLMITLMGIHYLMPRVEDVIDELRDLINHGWIENGRSR